MRTTKPPTLEKPPTCPRCGYDLTGTIAAWADHCPLEGTCSECGLHLHWSDVLVGQRALPNWHAENPKGRPFLSRLFRTVFCTLWPSRFWSSTRLEHAILPAALRRYLAAAFLTVALVSTAAEFVACLYVNNGDVFFDYLATGRFSDIWARGAFHAVINAAAPLRSWSTDLLSIDGPLSTGQFLIVVHENLILETFPYLALLTIALVPFTYRLIPTTLGARKVRPAHIWRAAAYGFIPILILLEVSLCISRLLLDDAYPSDNPLVALFRSGVAPLALAALWQTLWWWQVNARYLRIPRPGLVAVGMVLIAVLLAGLSVFATPLGDEVMLQLV